MTALRSHMGKTYGRLTVLRELDRDAKNRRVFETHCSCGVVKVVSFVGLLYGGVRSCGCLRRETTAALRRRDVCGETFGRLTVVARAPAPASNKEAGLGFWRCLCSCGRETVVNVRGLRSGNTKSCGCLNLDNLRARRGPLHPNYNPELTDGQRTGRQDRVAALRVWRRAVYARDRHTCQACGTVGGRLNAHHVMGWRDFPGLQTRLWNGITLCLSCHKHLHMESGHGNRKSTHSGFVKWLRIQRVLNNFHLDGGK